MRILLFSHVVKQATIWILLTLGVMFWWSVRQVDIQNAFLNDDLAKTIYMQQPMGSSNGSFQVSKLHKSIYNLK